MKKLLFLSLISGAFISTTTFAQGPSKPATQQPTAQLRTEEQYATMLKEAKEKPELVHGAPYAQPVRRLDDVKAARDLDLVWRPNKEKS